MSLRTTFSRSLRAASTRPALPSTHVFARAFSKPSSSALAAEDEEKSRKAYEKHRGQVDPKLAAVDESITFQEPKVS